MDPTIAFVLGLTLLALVVLVREWIPADGVALALVGVLVVGGIVDAGSAVAAFGNGAVVTVGASFVLAAGLTRSGALDPLAKRLLSLSGGSPGRVVVILMATVATLSAFMNNTPLCVMFMPITLALARHTSTAPSKLLIPMSYAAIVGGMCTLIGTSTNVLVSGDLRRRGLDVVGMFEPLPLGIAGVALTIAYMATVGRRLLPSRPTVSTTVREAGLSDYVTEVALSAESTLLGQGVEDVARGAGAGLRVLRVIRGEEGFAPNTPGLVLAAGDSLLVRGDAAQLLRLARERGADLTPDLRHPTALTPRETTLVELIVRPGSPAIGQSVAELGLHARTGALVVGVQRHEAHVQDRLGRLVLRFGDVLLVQVDDVALSALHRMSDFLIAEPSGSDTGPARRPRTALVTLGAFVALSAVGIPRLDVPVLAVLAAFAMVATGCVATRDAYRAIDLRLLVMMAGMIVLGEGLSSSGASAFLAGRLVDLATPLGPVAILGAIYLTTNLLTALVSNAAAALIMLPVALETAALAHLSSRPFVMAILFAASIDFSTPIGYQTNMLVYAAGGYRFKDFVRVGAPLNVLWWMLATWLIPVFWPLAL